MIDMDLTSHQEKWLLRALSSVNFVHILDFMILMPLSPYLIAEFGVSVGTFSLLVSVYAISAALCGIGMGGIIDRFNRRRLFFVVLGIFATATLACVIVPSFIFLILARALAGASGGLLGVMVKTLVADAIPPERRGLAMGQVMLGFAAASIFGVPVSLSIAASAGIYSWRAAFLFVVLCTIVVLFLARRFLPQLTQRDVHSRSALAQFWMILSEPRHRAPFLFSACVILGAFTVIPFIALYMAKNVGIDTDHLAYIYLFGGIASLLVSRTIGRLADRVGVRKVFTISALLSIIPLLLITHLPAVPIWMALTLTTLFFVAMSGRMVPAQTLLSLVPHAAMRGGFMSVQTSIEQVSMGLASLLAGAIVHQDAMGHLENYSSAGYVAIGFLLIAIYLAYRCVLAKEQSTAPLK